MDEPTLSIEEMEFSLRTMNALTKAGVKTSRDLMEMGEGGIRKLAGAGTKTSEEIAWELVRLLNGEYGKEESDMAKAHAHRQRIAEYRATLERSAQEKIKETKDRIKTIGLLAVTYEKLKGRGMCLDEQKLIFKALRDEITRRIEELG